jgi:hypothetical protein
MSNGGLTRGELRQTCRSHCKSALASPGREARFQTNRLPLRIQIHNLINLDSRDAPLKTPPLMVEDSDWTR